MHDNRCVFCHDENMYRRGKLVNSCDQLRMQVDIWQSNLLLNWRTADVEDVASYLNDRFYRFKCRHDLLSRARCGTAPTFSN